MIATPLFLSPQKGNAQGFHCILTNHVDYFTVSVLYRQNPAARSHLLHQNTFTFSVFFCLWLCDRTVLSGCSSPLFCFHVGQTANRLLSSLTQFEYHWALQATSAMAQLWPRIFCCISTMEAVVEETLLEIAVPKATPMQWSPPTAGGEIRVFKQCRCSLSIATTMSSALRLQCEVAGVWITLAEAGLLCVQDSKRWWQAFCNNL